MCIVYSITELVYSLFLAYFIAQTGNSGMINCALIIFFILLIFGIPATLLIYFLRDRKKYFIITSIYTIILSAIVYFFGDKILALFNVKAGLINFTKHTYQNLFMFSPLFSLYFLSLHKMFYKKQNRTKQSRINKSLAKQKKQLYLIIALKRLIPMFLVFILLHKLSFTNLLYVFAITELFLNSSLLIYLN